MTVAMTEQQALAANSGNSAPVSVPAPAAAGSAPQAPAVQQQQQQAAAPGQPNQQPGWVPYAALKEERGRVSELKAQMDNQSREIAAMQERLNVAMRMIQPPAAPIPPPQNMYSPNYPGYYLQPPQQPPMYGGYEPAAVPQYQPPPQVPQQPAAYDQFAALRMYDGVRNSIESQLANLKNAYPDVQKYEGEIRSLIDTIPLEQRGADGVVQTMYALARGKELMSAPPPPPPGFSPQGSGSSGQQQSLSEEEMSVIRRAGISPEEYLKYKREG